MPLDGANKDLGRFVMSAKTPMVFEGIFEAKKIKIGGKEQGDPKYSLGLTLAEDHPDLDAMKKTAVAVARAAWPGIDLKDIQFPFKRGDTFITDQEKKGKPVKDPETFAKKVMITARTKNPPNLSGYEGSRGIVDYSDPAAIAAKRGTMFYRGVDVLCELYFAASEPNGSKVVSIFLNKVMSTGTGKKLSSGMSGASTFSGYVGHHTDADPTQGLTDDEISF